MATKKLKNIFLSASIPFSDRHPKYFETADIIAIRDSIIALTSIVVPKYRLIWGGHPSITPIIYHVMKKINIDIQEHVTIYQSKYFENIFPMDNEYFENILITEDLGDQNSSLALMRKKMLSENKFEAGIFIGGMEGIEIEFDLFSEFQPQAIILPIASTGGASKIIYEKHLAEKFKNKKLITDYGYMSLFQELLIDKIK